ncbi:CoA transferase [Arthrobacter tumbae]|uniref:CoA transferase n=1 Tax=Arthrobacter tumbae TaxID=163874 RepID=UPI00195F0870|nr:CoA transferase [Arthrobacter tumbae]MBM7781472.1 crotonobetainyl-CoA:carnitine CoA-transferase CaiB-like acyl-CoA transferase [Arthrobacter tumbae]
MDCFLPGDDPVPGLWGYFAPLLPELTEPASWSGPRWWWKGPLDVEGLALGSVQAVATSLAAASPGRNVTFTSPGVAAWFDSFTHFRIAGSPIQAFAPLSGFRRAADGWVRLHGNYPHHEQALLTALGVSAVEDVDAALLEYPAAAIEEAVTARGGLAAAVRTPQEWATTPAGRAVADEPFARLSTSTFRRGTRTFGGSKGLLDGVRVLDLTRVIAGPSASRLLGALGADVLRVDPVTLPELEHQHVETGFAKRSAVADFNDPEQLARLRALLPAADVVLSAYRGGAMDRYGLGINSLRADFPGLAVVVLDAWGDAGPWADRRGFDSIVQAATGIAQVYGTGSGTDFRPGALPVQALDYATGLGMAASAVGLVTARSRGLSGSAHLSLARTATELLRMRVPGIAPSAEAETPLRRSDSAYGELVFVPPPLVIDGRQIEYPYPPQRYGSASLEWR